MLDVVNWTYMLRLAILTREKEKFNNWISADLIFEIWSKHVNEYTWLDIFNLLENAQTNGVSVRLQHFQFYL